MIWLMARAIASLTSTPGWWVPLETGFPSVGFRHEPSGTRSSMQSKKPSFLGMLASTMLASWAMALPRVFPNVDQAWISGRLSEPAKSMISRSPVDRDGHVDVDVAVPGRVGIEVDVGLVGAVGPGGDLLGEAAARVGDRPVHGRAHDVGPVVVDDRLQALGPELGRTHLGTEITDEAGQSVVRPHHQDDVPTLHAGVEDLQDRISGAFAPDVLGEDVVPAGHGAARVTVMALDGREEDEFPVVVEDRAEDVEVREMAATVVRVVGHDHIAGVQIVLEEVDGQAHGQGRGRA